MRSGLTLRGRCTNEAVAGTISPGVAVAADVLPVFDGPDSLVAFFGVFAAEASRGQPIWMNRSLEQAVGDAYIPVISST